MALMDRVLNSRRFTNDGPLVREFEDRIAERCAVSHFVATCNGTQALELLARVDGIAGEVVIPAFTFVATAHAFHSAGAKVVFCDVEPGTMNIDPDSCRLALSDETSAICGVHLWGRSAATSPLASHAQAAGIPLYFDAAHAFGCGSGGRPVGGFGRAEVFSFHATKILHTMEGGGIATQCGALAHELRLARNFGFQDYDTVVRSGTNAKMAELNAACGLAILETLEHWIGNAAAVHAVYARRTAGMPGLRLVEAEPGGQCNWQYVVARVEPDGFGLDRDLLARALHAEGVLARRYFHPGLHRMAPYVQSPPRVPLPHTEALARTVIVLPGGGALSVGEAERVCDAIERIHAHREALV